MNKFQIKHKNTWNKRILFLIGLFLSSNLFYCQKKVDKEKLKKVAMANLVLNQESTVKRTVNNSN